MDTWQQMYEQLADYARHTGHCRVPAGWKENPRLAKWVSRQRALADSLAPNRKARLDQLGFLWKADIQRANQAQWADWYTQLAAFCQQHGHCRVPGGPGEWSRLRSWVDRQRRDWNTLSPEQQQQLLAAGFTTSELLQDQTLRQWQRFYQRLERYVLVYGHARVPKNWPVDPQLAHWVARQRTYPQRLTPEQKRRLDGLGFPWKKDIRRAKQEYWLRMYEQLEAFHQTHGHTRVPDQYAENPTLGKWVSWQRKRQNKLSAERRRKLDALGFVWQIDRQQEHHYQWYRQYGRLKAFHRQYGHSRVPENWPEDKSLAIWVAVQRQQGRQLPDWKRNRLNQLGFVWQEDLRQERLSKWETNFERLRAFHAEHGHCQVTLSNTPDEKFFRWVAKQRRFRHRLDSEQVHRLIDLGFRWPEDNQQVRQDKWETHYQALLAFRRQYGHCRVAEDWPENPALARWVAFQRRQEAKLPPDRKARLNALRFAWKADIQASKDQEWLEMYDRLVAYRQRFGNCRVPFTWVEDKHLGHWVRRQRLQREKMPPERVSKLEALAFEWQVR